MNDADLAGLSLLLAPSDVVAEFLALSVVESTFTQGTTIKIELDGARGRIVDTGRGMNPFPDPGDTMSHVQRALTSVYPIVPENLQVLEVLTDLVWGSRGSLGPSVANNACVEFRFTSYRQGVEWTQVYRYGVPDGPAIRVGATGRGGTMLRFETLGEIDVSAVTELVRNLRTRIPSIAITGP